MTLDPGGDIDDPIGGDLSLYQNLAGQMQQLVEKRRGVGMFVASGAREQLLKDEREKFLSERWPQIRATIQRLGLAGELLGAAAKPPGEG